MINLLSTPDHFKLWLDTKQSTEIIGERGTCINCPLANFLKEAEYLNCFIGSNSYSLNADYSDTEQWGYHTNWMKSFIYKIERNQSIQITKELALSLVGDL